MEVHHIDEAVQSILKAHEIQAYFSEKELKDLGNGMIRVIQDVLGSRTVKEISFHEDNNMFFDLEENSIHLGLGLIREVLDFWYGHLTGQGTIYIPRDMIQEKIVRTFRAVAAHEAGHRVADCNPIKDLGISREEWGNTGFSSLQNMLMDCRNNCRIDTFHEDLRIDMDAMYEYGTSPAGRYDWTENKEERMKKNGYTLLFPQFECECYRWSVKGEIHPETDPRVRSVLETHKEDIHFITRHKSCIPGKDPQKIEKKAKARNAYRKIAEINQGDYQKVLVKRDRDNQTIHQAISIVGLREMQHTLPEVLQNIIDEALKKLDPVLKNELKEKLQQQKEEKIAYDEEHKSVESITQETHAAISGQKQQPKDYFEILGPAVHVEELSDPLRQFLIELFKDMQQALKNQIIEELLKKLLEDPEKFLKKIEDEMSEKFRPHTKPPMSPTHQELDQEPSNPDEETPEVVPGNALFQTFDRPVTIDTREFAEIEQWIDKHFDMDEMIRRWQKAIRILAKTGEKLTDEPTADIDFEAYVDDEMRKKAGMRPEGKFFIEDMPKQLPISISILWRTQNVRIEDAVKLILFIMRIYSAPGIRKYLCLELLVSQHLEGDSSPVPAVLDFSQDPIQDYEEILKKIKSLKGVASSTISISQDATALRTQRERLLKERTKNKFSIDLWDEAAMEAGSQDPLKDVTYEIGLTQKALRGKAFCFVLGRDKTESSSPARAYGEEHFLAEKSTVRLLQYMDIAIRCMIQYKENYSSRINEMIREELNP